MSHCCLSTTTVKTVFSQVIETFSGQVAETFEDGRRLFTRSLLPLVKEVRPKDRLHGGVALKATEREICLFPYVFREVCSNGAIMAHALAAQRLEFSDEETSDEMRWHLRQAIGVCCQSDVFETNICEIQPSLTTEVDMALNFLPFVARMPQAFSGELLRHIFERFWQEGGRSRFDLMNAVTSVARDTRDPDQRWRLEELGGAIGAGIHPNPPARSPGVSVFERQVVEV